MSSIQLPARKIQTGDELLEYLTVTDKIQYLSNTPILDGNIIDIIESLRTSNLINMHAFEQPLVNYDYILPWTNLPMCEINKTTGRPHVIIKSQNNIENLSLIGLAVICDSQILLRYLWQHGVDLISSFVLIIAAATNKVAILTWLFEIYKNYEA